MIRTAFPEKWLKVTKEILMLFDSKYSKLLNSKGCEEIQEWQSALCQKHSRRTGTMNSIVKDY